ncbi:hypothetical protein [Achromobacter sp. GD03932]|uniref:DUF7424 family protein n=1 Tax=Achromobacter sp. GD03932 TaxID=2975407 RepID=UPI0024480219|nr:hypothetical protein [Achromobacter sp. GD03932]MDH1300388.1 hypothetical protein [Achromobacter sp. GD03932]
MGVDIAYGEKMSRVKNAALLAFATALIAGCKTTVETEVSLSDLLTSPTKQLAGNLLVEVPACESLEDSRQPSEVLLDVQQAVPGIFSDAKYAECYRKGFNSFARFSLPIFLDKDRDGKLASDSHINLGSNEEGLLSVGVPQKIKAKIVAAQKNSPIGAQDLKFTIKVRNDTDKDFTFSALAVFIDQAPHVFSTLTSKAGGAFVVTLSDVSAKAAVDNGGALVLLHKSE